MMAAAGAEAKARYSAIVLGATGNVGGRIVQLLIRNPLCKKVVVVTRRKTDAFADPKASGVVVNMDRLEEELAPHTNVHCCTVRNKLACEELLPIVATTELLPFCTFGTTMLNWYNPGPMIPANWVDAAIPPILTVTGFAKGAGRSSCPTGLGGVVGPNPVPKSMIRSPGFAVTVV